MGLPPRRRPTKYEIELIEQVRMLSLSLLEARREHTEYAQRVNDSFARLGGDKGAVEMELKQVKRDSDVRVTAERDVYKALYEALLDKTMEGR